MLENGHKCTLNDHNEIEAIIYCQECKIYMCNKCEKVHSGLCKSHHSFNLDKNLDDIFTGLCKEKNHSMNLDYFCKSHNKLCCAACIASIKGKGNGYHKDCEICFIKKIKKTKKEKLLENIKYLEDISKELEKSIIKLKSIFEKINENKEKIKKEIQTAFTKVRNILNEREDKLLLEIDNKSNGFFFNEELIRMSEKLPKTVKFNLEKGKNIYNDEDTWNDKNKLSLLINDCINIEKNISDISEINSHIQRNLDVDLNIKFNSEDINKIGELMKEFGNLVYNDDKNKENFDENEIHL